MSGRINQIGSLLSVALIALSAVVLLGSSTAPVRADPYVAQVGDAFVSKLPSGWTATKGDWQNFNVIDCWTSGGNCWGNNPSSPYSSPTLPTVNGPSSVFHLNPNDAIVIFMRTPPRVRYFGFTQYLYSRYNTPVSPLFASLSDTLNIREFISRKTTVAGKDDENRYAVLVWTADLNSLDTMKSVLQQVNIEPENVNFIPLPIRLPLFMGMQPQNDTFTMMMRMAVPRVQANLDAYMNEKPFYVLLVSRDTAAPVNAAPTIGYANEISGVLEDASLQTALNNLVADIKAHYGDRYTFEAKTPSYRALLGLNCIQTQTACAADNHDALYSTDGNIIRVVHLNDLFFEVGVNHFRTGKVLYTNFAVYDTVHNAGVVAVADQLLTRESALYHAGVTVRGDPRIDQYQYLYAYAVSYDCTGIEYCQQIPPPTPDNPVGLNPGEPFAMVTRSYVDRTTLVRPSTTEIIGHQPMLATHK